MPSVAIAPSPVTQVLEGGLIIPGALIFCYAAGTTNKISAYTDSSGSVPLPNPIVCDANGQSVIYLTAGISYKLVYAPANDTDPPSNPYATYDNLYSAIATVIPYADAGGSADAITAAYVVTYPVLIDGYFMMVDIATPNATTTPTFAPTLNGVLQTARTVVKMVGNVVTALGIGDLQGKAELVYDLPNLVWVLQNPSVSNLHVALADLATYATTLDNTAAEQLSTITATVATNALTIGALTQYLDFRSATLSLGTVSTIISSPTNLVIPSTATLGTSNGAAAILVVAELLNAGVAELAVANIVGLSINEDVLMTTVAVIGGSNLAGTWYSTTQRTGVPYRVIGYLYITEATAGTWATAPSTIGHATSVATDTASKTGTGSTYVTNTSPTLITPNLGTPSALVGTNITGIGSIAAFAHYFQSVNITIGFSTQPATAHGLGGKPLLLTMVMKCITSELGYTGDAVTGDEITITSDNDGSATTTLIADATNITVSIGSGITINNKNSNTRSAITAANWVFVVRAWK